MSASELRQDPLSGRWVIIAAERGKRPDDFRPAAAEAERREAAPAFCPFCAGNETKTPPEVEALREPGTRPDTPGWRVRVVPNKYPALTPGGPPVRRVRGLYESMDGIGVHEVIIDSPDHARELTDLPLSHVKEALEVYVRRIRGLENDPAYRYVQLFKNKGREAGASLSHPHTQIVATPITPKRVKEEIWSSERFWKDNGSCIFCRLTEEERTAGERIVAANDHFIAFIPFAARFPFEIHFHPLRHATHFTSQTEDELDALAEILKTALGKLKAVLGDPPYNLVLHQAPNPATVAAISPDLGRFFHWYLEVIPVLTRVAGFEWGTGFYINPVSPENAAQYLR
jgi:UDPglucose--hexose-1-phosphate uridylyltransferase